MAESKLATIPTRVLITQEAKTKIDRLVFHCTGEVYWFGLIDQMEMHGNKYLRLYDILIPKQEVSSSSVDIDSDAIDELLQELIEAERLDDIANMRFFGHSHGNLGVFHSSTDWEQIETWASKMQLPWFVSQVSNRKGDTTLRLDMFEPFKLHIDDLHLTEMFDGDIDEWVVDQIDKKVEEKKVTTTRTGFHGSTPHGTSSSRSSSWMNVMQVEGRFEGALEHYLRLKPLEKYKEHEDPDELILQRVVDGWVVEEQNLTTGRITTYKTPTIKEREKHLLEEGLLDEEDLPYEPYKSISSRSTARSDAKREGGGGSNPKVGEPVRPVSQAGLPTDTWVQRRLTGLVEEREAREERARAEALPEEAREAGLVLPPGVDLDEVYSDEEAARIQSLLDDELTDDGLEIDGEMVLSLEDVDPDDLLVARALVQHIEQEPHSY